MYPVPSNPKVTFKYGAFSKAYRDRRHKGVDSSAKNGAKVVATVSGTVVHAGWHLTGGYTNRGWGYAYGKQIIIKQDPLPDGSAGLFGGYMHLSDIKVKRGQRVKAGQLIGLVGATGNASGSHLHYEIQKKRFWGGWTGSVNPQKWLDA